MPKIPQVHRERERAISETHIHSNARGVKRDTSLRFVHLLALFPGEKAIENQMYTLYATQMEHSSFQWNMGRSNNASC